MAKDKDKSHAADMRPPPSEGGGMSTGVAIIGFILCFMAGGAVMWGYDSHRMKTAGGITADSSSGRRRAVGGHRLAHSRHEPGPRLGKSRGAGHDRHVLGLPVSVLLARRADARSGQDHLRSRQGPHRLEEPAAAVPRQGEAGRRSRADRLRAQGLRGVLEVPRHRVQEPGALSPESYEKWAVAAGVDANAFKAGLATHKAAKKVEEDMAIGNKVGANGTPAFRINGVELSGAQPFDKFKETIDKELAKAEAKIKAGTPKDKIYVAMSTENFKNAPAPKREEDEEEKEDTKTVWKVPVGNSPVQGKADAPVTIIEFSDFQCPYCKRVEPQLKKIKETYGDKVRLVWKHEPLPFHPRARAGRGAHPRGPRPEGRQGLLGRARQAVRHRSRSSRTRISRRPPRELGLDVAKVKAAIKDAKYKKDIDADMELGEDVQASGTPHFFVNGRRLVGAQPFEKFQKIIDEELAKYDAQKGKIAGKDYYASLMKDAKGAPEPEKKLAPPVPAGQRLQGRQGREGRHPAVERLPVPVLLARRADRQRDLEDLRRQGEDRVARQAPPDAPERAARGRGRSRGAQAEGPRRLLEDAQADVREPAEAGSRRSRGLRQGRSASTWTSSRPRSTTTSHKAAVDADDKAGTDLGISGTPAFLINGYYVSGAQPFPKFKKLIDRAMAEAK